MCKNYLALSFDCHACTVMKKLTNTLGVCVIFRDKDVLLNFVKASPCLVLVFYVKLLLWLRQYYYVSISR